MIRPVQDLGWAVLRFITDLGALALFTLQVVRATLVPPWRLRLFVDELHKLGVLSLVIICVCGLAVGMVLGLQGYNTLVRFGAAESLGADGAGSGQVVGCDDRRVLAVIEEGDDARIGAVPQRLG